MSARNISWGIKAAGA